MEDITLCSLIKSIRFSKNFLFFYVFCFIVGFLKKSLNHATHLCIIKYIKEAGEMTPEDMFLDYRLMNPKVTDYTHCIVSEYIGEKILNGDLKSFAVGQSVYDATGEDFPQTGDIQVVTGNNGDALCLIKVESVVVMMQEHIPDDVPCLPSRREGELYTVLLVDVVMR